eukprot:1924229-Ditylum_brightwellii.AAC.1
MVMRDCSCGGGACLFLGGVRVVRKELQSWGLEFQSFGGWLVEKGSSTRTRFSFEFQIHPPGGP